MSSYTIRQFISPDWEVYKLIRMRALQWDIGFFATTYEEMKKMPDDFWKERLKSEHYAYFGLFADGEIAGMTGIAYNEHEEGEAELIASYIEPKHRGQGLSSMLYQARIDWARSKGLKRLIVSHRETNIASMKANQRSGFKYTHKVMRMWLHGQWDNNVYYELYL